MYLFLGSKSGLSLDPSQRIEARDVTFPGLTTFGYSISSGLDQDDNGYSGKKDSLSKASLFVVANMVCF